MATKINSKTTATHKLGYTQSQIRERATNTKGVWWTVRCFNGAAHKNGDKHPSAFYNAETGYYGCRVCDLKGFANDRDHPDWNKRQTRTYSNGVEVTRDRQSGSKNFWQANTGTKKLAKPYHHETIHDSTRTIYIVEGEKCAETLQPHLDHKTQAVITSIGGSNAARKTDWSVVAKVVKRDSEIVFIPDRDEPGEKYIQAVAQLLNLEKIKVIRLGDDNCKPGYDIADWLEDGNEFLNLPTPLVETVAPINGVQAEREDRKKAYESVSFKSMFGHHTPARLEWLEEGMIPARKLTLLVGRAAIGKSAMALYIASAVSNGQSPFSKEPLGSELFADNQRVLIYTSEDDWNDTIAVRLEMMGANMQNIAPLFSQKHGVGRSFDWSGRASEDEPSDLDLLVDGIRQQPIGLLIIDPLIDVITGGNNNDPAVIREAIETKINPLLDLGATVLGIHHERKDAKKDDLLVDRAIGSQAWTGVARSVLNMQALPTHKAIGTGKKPRTSLDGKFKISQKKIKDSNSDVCGVIVVSKSNLAKVDGGFHYELPSRVPDGQTSSFIEVAINPSKITKRTPEELVQIYNPVAQEKAPEAAVNTKARRDMAQEISAEKTAESVISEFFDDQQDNQGRVSAAGLVDWVMDAAMVGRNNAERVIRGLTDKVRVGNTFYRVLKKPRSAD